MTADRLVLVDGGTAKEYDGSMEDYIDFVLGRNQPKKEGAAKPKKSSRGKSSKDRAKARAVQAEISRTEKLIAKLQAECTELDRAMYEPANADSQLADKPMSELLAKRASVSDQLESAEAEWLSLGEKIESV